MYVYPLAQQPLGLLYVAKGQGKAPAGDWSVGPSEN